MRKASCIAAVMGMMMLPCVSFTQTPGSNSGTAPAVAATADVPLDQQPTKGQLAKLFELMRVRDQMAQMTKMMPSLMQQQMQAQFKQMQQDHPEMASMTEEQQQASAKVMSKFMEQVMNLNTSHEMIADMATIYQKHLTRSDVDEIIAFYSSPAGQHFIDMTPVIMKECMPLVMQRMQERINPLIGEMTKEMGEVFKFSTPAADKPAQK